MKKKKKMKKEKKVRKKKEMRRVREVRGGKESQLVSLGLVLVMVLVAVYPRWWIPWPGGGHQCYPYLRPAGLLICPAVRAKICHCLELGRTLSC